MTSKLQLLNLQPLTREEQMVIVGGVAEAAAEPYYYCTATAKKYATAADCVAANCPDLCLLKTPANPAAPPVEEPPCCGPQE